MAEFKCDSCQKTVLEKDKYKIRCSGECRRNFCMTCTGLDKTTTKVLHQQKYHNIRFFCTVCDSPTLKYLHDKLSQLQKSQLPLENVEALGSCLKKNNDIFPIISEVYDILNTHDSKWKSLYKKIDDIHSLHNKMSDNVQESLFKSIKERKQDIFNLSSILMDNNDGSIKVQVHDSSKEELIKEMADLRQSVKQMSRRLEEFAAKDITNMTNTRNGTQTVKKTISTQTDHTNSLNTVVTTSPKITSSPPHKTPTKEEWQYVVVSKIPPPYTANQLAHYVKEKLGTTDFIRCFPMLKNKDSSHSDFKIGVQNSGHLKQLKDIRMWPPGTIIHTANLLLPPSKLRPPTLSTSSTSYHHRKINTVENGSVLQQSDSPLVNTSREAKTVKIGSDREAIAAIVPSARKSGNNFRQKFEER